jgi:hypothetical protein
LEPLLPAALLKNIGEMSLAQRKQHPPEKAGTEWFLTGELDLMLSILVCDGRYEDAAFILPVSFSNILKDGVFAHARYKALLKLERDNASMDEKEREDMILEMLGANSEKIQKLQEQQQNYVLNKIIDQNPGFLSKKVLVFPHNKDQMHWSVTFVFNAGFVREKLDDSDNSIPSLQSCFFRYCSFVPDGTRDVPVDTGIIWFLNLCFSNDVHEESEPAPNAAMEWLSPFGKSFQGDILGTKDFPALRLPERNLLPKQEDGYNCGMGIVASIAIILRNVCNEKVDQMLFIEQIPRTTGGSSFFDKRFFESIPTKENELILADYLTMLRSEWFVVFDRMAALHFEVLPQRLNKENLVNPLYTETKKHTLKWSDFDTMKMRQAMPKGKLRVLAKELDEKKALKEERRGTAKKTGSVAIDVTQSPYSHVTIDLSSPERPPHKSESHTANFTIDLSSPETRKLSASLVEANQQKGSTLDEALLDTPKKAEDVLVNDNVEDTPEKSEVVNEDPAFTITKLEDLSLLTPVKIQSRICWNCHHRGRGLWSTL